MESRKCKYCKFEMDLMETSVNYEFWVCMNEECEGTLTLDDQYDWEQWAKDGEKDFN